MATKAAPCVPVEERWIDADREDFRRRFDRLSFELQHRLSTHALFQLPALMQLAERTLKRKPSDLYYDMGSIQVGQRWDRVPDRKFSAEQALQRIENCGAWFIFRSTQTDPEYKIFLDRGLAELKELIGGNIDSQILREDIIIFVTSPKRISAYHIDRECNFLLQIRGTKTIHVFDREDREVLPETEIERFWSVDHNAALYKPHLQDRARSYRLRPGNGVHIPVNCPHWVQNDDNVSVSLSVNFQFKDRKRANIYRANFLLRRLGLKPTPPGKSQTLDSVKSAIIVPIVWAKNKSGSVKPKRKAAQSADDD
ncbi:MAG: cupin-like domain-containing protein [Candidatus Acidiferrales bacterium]